jgi:hypothetical protein
MTPRALPELAADPEPRFVEFAKDQPQYQTLPALIYRDGVVMTEWVLTEDERLAILSGENIRLWISTFGKPLQPVHLEVTSEHQP